MKTHTTLGRDTIENAQQRVGMHSPLLETAKEIALSHHEKWDGSGYPQGLAGEAIPLSARLMAAADVYDALVSRRVYKKPLPHAEAIGIIVDAATKHFDPDVVDALVAVAAEFELIAARHCDQDSELEALAERARSSVNA